MTDKNLVLGIAGEKGSGKDTVCDFLVANYGFTKMSLAGPLKEIVGKVFPEFPPDHLWGESKLREIPAPQYPLSGSCPLCGRRMKMEGAAKWVCGCGFEHEAYLTPRLALQTLGTEWGRRLYEDVWVDYLFSEIDRLGLRRVCISDVRFPNEVRRIRQHNGLVLRLKRKSSISKVEKRASSMWDVFHRLYGGKKTVVHASEMGLDGVPPRFFVGVIENNRTIPDLHAEVVSSLEWAL